MTSNDDELSVGARIARDVARRCGRDVAKVKPAPKPTASKPETGTTSMEQAANDLKLSIRRLSK